MEFVGFDTIVDLVNEEILSFYEIENNKIFQKRRVSYINAIDYDNDLGIDFSWLRWCISVEIYST